VTGGKPLAVLVVEGEAFAVLTVNFVSGVQFSFAGLAHSSSRPQ
jgi:hypothetical protein